MYTFTFKSATSLHFFGKRSWFTTMLCVSISYAVSSWTRRSVSYSDRNSEIQMQTKVVFSCRHALRKDQQPLKERSMVRVLPDFWTVC
jgi:hypothetical protein